MQRSPTLVFVEWFERVWNQRDASAIDQLRAERSQSTGLANASIDGRDAYRAHHQRILEVFPEAKVTVLDVIESGDRVAALLRFTGKTAKGQSVTVDGAAHGRVADGRIVGGTNVWNVGAAAKSLGLKACGTLEDLVEQLR